MASPSNPNPNTSGERSSSSSGAAELCLGLRLGPSVQPPPPQPTPPMPVGAIEVPVHLAPTTAARPLIPRDPQWKARRQEARQRKEEKQKQKMLMAGARPGWPYFVDRWDPRLDFLAAAAAAVAAAGFGPHQNPQSDGNPCAALTPNQVSAWMPDPNLNAVMTCPPAFGPYPPYAKNEAACGSSYVPCLAPPPPSMAAAEGGVGFGTWGPNLNLAVAPADVPDPQSGSPIQVMPTPRAPAACTTTSSSGTGKGKKVTIDETPHRRPPSSPSSACSFARAKLAIRPILKKPTTSQPPAAAAPPGGEEAEKIWVACRADGRLMMGYLYKYTRAEVVIVCKCHGRAFTPAEFVSHAGCTDVSQPLKHIFVCPLASI